MKTKINLKVVKGVIKYLEQVKHYDILQEGFATDKDYIPIVAYDPVMNTLVLVDCEEVKEFKNDNPSRKRFERLFVSWFKQHPDEAPQAVRLDIVQMIITDDGLGLVRHDINALCRD